MNGLSLTGLSLPSLFLPTNYQNVALTTSATGDDAVTVAGTVAGTTTINTKGGKDFVNVQATTGITPINGGATTDHFVAGVKFQRVTVPTASGRPSISIPLWVMDSAQRYRTQRGSLRFLYGYVTAADGVRRFG